MNLKRLALMSCVALGIAAPAFADVAGGPGGLFKTADTNKDGVVDQTEFQASRDKWFAELDANKDGFITTDELKAFGDKMRAQWQQKHADAQGATGQPDGTPPAADASRGDRMAQHILARVDTDHDGKISKVEFDAESATLFKRLDKNSDGKIAADEVPARHWGARGPQFGMMDTDKDGKVTKAEFTAAEDRMFQKLDANGDGVITRDEMQAAHHRHGQDGMVPPPGAPAPDQAPTP
ncbi:MAG TPA: EF-hand domain-containing protein [Dongiaceae bacterium]|jgi:Ca2+-binding EF-hand superfamily protein|nr:EF-hand domain-containing protein [Dongiaceae bacterium]